MNIVFTSNTYWPLKNGVQMVNQYLAEGLVSRGHNVTVLTGCANSELESEEIHSGVHIRRFHIQFTKYRKYIGDIKGFQEHLLMLDKKSKIDVMITVSANSFAGFATLPIIDKLKCRKLLYNHGMRDGKLHIDKITSMKSMFKEIILGKLDVIFYKKNWEKIMMYDAAVHLFPKDSTYNFFKKHGFHNNYIILNACEDSLFEDENKVFSGTGNNKIKVKEKYNINNPFFIYVANYCWRKDQKRAVEVFYKADIIDKDLVLIGSKKNAYCETLIKQVLSIEKKFPNHGKIHILYDIDRVDTISLIKEAYACFMSSMNEYFPITIIEAAAAGKPYVSTNVGVVSLLPGGNITHNNDELSYWLEYYAQNADYVSHMGDIAKEYAKKNLMCNDKINQLEQILISL